MLEGTNITICDWRGHVIWQSAKTLLEKPEDFVWEHLVNDSADLVKASFSRVVSLREEAMMEFENNRGQHFRAWMWPLEKPDIAVCMLSIVIPKALTSLTIREREILELLAQGQPTREIALVLDVSASTVHTHLRKARKKLAMPSVESLTGFAARYCHPQAAPNHSINA